MGLMARAVEGAGSHPLPGFSYAGDAEVLGALFVGLVHDSGSRVVLPAASVLTIGERPGILDVVSDVAADAAGHDGYHQVDRIAALPDRVVIKVAEVDEVRGVYRRASLYAVPSCGLIIKAFDKAPTREAVAQFAVMTALHETLSRAPGDEPIRLQSPEQYALIQPPTGKHRTIVMKMIEGRRLYDLLSELPQVQASEIAARRELSRMIKPVLEAAVVRQVDAGLLPYVNDITGGAEGGLYTNLIVPTARLEAGPTTTTDVATMISGAAIIDQPRFLPEIAARGWRDGMDRIAKLLNR
jgi:hypothetical protein